MPQQEESEVHLDPVQFLFEPVKGVVANLVVGTHRDDRLPRRLEGITMELAM